MSNPFEKLPTPEEVDELVDEIKQHLQGKGPALQGAALVDLVAMYFAGHHPQIRAEALEVWLDTMRALIKVNEKTILEHYGAPDGWRNN